MPEVEARRTALTTGLDESERDELGRLLLRMARSAVRRLASAGERSPATGSTPLR